MKISQKGLAALFFVGILAIAGFFIVSKLLPRKGLEDREYSAEIRTAKKKNLALEGEKLPLVLKLKNTGQRPWSSQTAYPCRLSYHLLDRYGNIVQFDNERFSFSSDIEPDQNVKFSLSIRSPLEAGKYIVEFDLLREGISWFKDAGSETERIFLEVKKRKWPEDDFPWSLEKRAYTKFHSSVAEFNTLGRLIRLTLEDNRVEIQGRLGKILSFTPGADYPQVWLRDANTILPVSRYYYGTSYLASWLEEHLAHQKEDGSLEDWIGSRGESGKNTTETDQETSAVQSAHHIFLLLGPRWIKKKIENEEIIHRLERALLFVLQNRFDDSYGLVTGAHTADWGDVDLIDSDERAVDVDDRTKWTLDIYDQSMFYQAALQLAEMWMEADREDRALFWVEKAEDVKKSTDKWLWNEETGFYRIHLHLEDWEHDFDEEDLLAMGGNCLAVLSGLSGSQKSVSIIEEVLKRQGELSISTVSGTLLPPYPENVFKHPLLDSPYEYQNGGQWDWFGGRFILAMFLEGFSSQAREKLLEIAQKNLAQRCLYEWDDRAGTGRGSEAYSGSAGSLGRALIEGYFGILWKEDGFELQPRLGQDSGHIHVYISAADAFVAYGYTFVPQEETIEFSFNSGSDNRTAIKILSPWEDTAQTSENKWESSYSVRLDGTEIPFRLQRLNDDIYFVVNTDLKNHTLEVKRRKANHLRPIE